MSARTPLRPTRRETRSTGRVAANWLGIVAVTLLGPVATARERDPRVAPAISATLAREAAVLAVVELRETEPRTEGSARLPARQVRRGLLGQAPSELQRALLARLRGDFDVRYAFRCSPVLVLAIRDADVLRQLKSDPAVASVGESVRGRGALADTRRWVGADRAQELGYLGAGTVVATLDTGIDETHPDLAGAVIHEKRFLDRGFDIDDDATDGHGHGTHVAGILASRGTVSPLGIAPEAAIVAVKVLDDANEGWLVDWVAGLEHVIELHTAPRGIRVDVINMSLITEIESASACDASNLAFSRACARARELGITLFAAAGNRGSHAQLTMPACFSSVLSVGSSSGTAPELVSLFSNRGALLSLLAPGERVESTHPGGGTFSRDGTSQATPHAAATALLLREIDPALSPDEIASALVSTGAPIADAASGRTYRRIDALAAATHIALPVPGLTCRYLGDRMALRIAWAPLAGATHLEITVRHGASIRFRGQVSAGSGIFDLPIGDAAGTFAVSARARSGAHFGREGSCAIEVQDPDRSFLRSDCNSDGRVDIGDPVRALGHLFLGEPSPPACLAACDVNDDGHVDLGDPIFLLGYLFRGSDEPAPPFPDCGQEPSPDGVACLEPRCAP